MSFSFDFEDEPEARSQSQKMLDSVEVNDRFLPRVLSLTSLLQSLVGARFTFTSTAASHGKVYRREVFDVKHQIMMEDTHTEETQILLGDEDLRNNVYEGGLKSWECSFDVVNKLSEMSEFPASIVEIGCGSSLPSCFIFKQLLHAEHVPTKFILTDYNESILRLVTLPNLIINWAKSMGDTDFSALQADSDTPVKEDELQITPNVIDQFCRTLQLANIDLCLVAGAWCAQFLHLLSDNLSPHQPSLIISSETIYSPQALPIVGEVFLGLLENAKESKVLVAAKDIYFGVGGSVNEFLAFLQRAGGVTFEVEKIDSQLTRSLIWVKQST